MGKILDVGQINIGNAVTDAKQLPVKSGTLIFLQQAHMENLAQVINQQIGGQWRTSVVYVLWGCVVNGGNISAGAVFFNGEVFACSGGSSVNTFFNIAVANFTADGVIAKADPVTYVGAGGTANVHNIRTMTISATAGDPGISTAPNSFLVYLTPVYLNAWQDYLLVANTNIKAYKGDGTSAGNLTINGGPSFRYLLIGKTLDMAFAVNITFPNNTRSIRITLPGGTSWHGHFNGDTCCSAQGLVLNGGGGDGTAIDTGKLAATGNTNTLNILHMSPGVDLNKSNLNPITFIGTFRGEVQ